MTAPVVTASRMSHHQELHLNIRLSFRHIQTLFALLLVAPMSLPVSALDNPPSLMGILPTLAGAPGSPTVVLPLSLAKAAGTAGSTDAANLATTRADYTDGWWVPSESGWGMNVLHQGDVMAIAFYVYDETNVPIWYLGVANYVDENIGYRGTLSLHRGTSFLLPVFGPVPSGPTAIGIITFKPTSPYSANVNYSVGTTSIDKSMVRIAFAPIEFGGSFLGGVTGTVTGCATGSGTFAMEQSLIVTSSVANGQAQLVFANSAGYCIITGTLQQNGMLGAVSNGSFGCTSGINGTASIDEWAVNRNGMSARYQTRTGSCVEEGRVSGARRQ